MCTDALKRLTHSQRVLWYSHTKVATLTKDECSIKLKYINKRVPMSVVKLWGDKVGQIIVLDPKDIEESKLEMARLRFSWRRCAADDFGNERMVRTFVYTQQDVPDDDGDMQSYVVFAYNGVAYWFNRLSDIDLCTINGTLIHELVPAQGVMLQII